MEEILQEITSYLTTINPYEATGLCFGLLSVIFLIKENIWTWPTGIIYVLVSLIVFWNEKLYADFALHIFFLGVNIYGWWYWIHGVKKAEISDERVDSHSNDYVPISKTKKGKFWLIILISIVGIFIMGYLFHTYTDASLPYWDSATTVLSLSAMWLTAKKKIENWYLWFVVDVLATLVYLYKDIYFYSILYLIYIGLAVSGYLEWRKTMKMAQA